MRVPVVLPHLGVSIEEATVVAWRSKPGEFVRAGDVICEIATDKVELEITASESGTFARALVAEGGSAAVGSPVAELDTAETPAETQAETQAETPTETAIEDQARVPAVVSGAVALAAGGAAPYDYRAAANALIADRESAAEPVPRRTLEDPGTLPPAYRNLASTTVPHSRRRRMIAEHMSRSRRTAAHVTTEVEVDMSAVASARRAMRKASGAGDLVSSPLAFVAAATCQALREHPDHNASYRDDALIRWQPVNLGIAVDTADGLIVPVIHDATRLNVTGLARHITSLAAAARAKTLTPDDVQGATFTITNPGSVGASSAMAIINQPQVAILGMAAIVDRVVPVTDEGGGVGLRICPMTTLSVSYDHRAVDGAAATRFAVTVKRLLENWSR